jgi:hypothetical protein
MTKTFEKRFQLVNSPFGGQPSLVIVDYTWWAECEREILNWMVEGLPRGIEHQQGMTITFDNDYDRINFLIRWGP